VALMTSKSEVGRAVVTLCSIEEATVDGWPAMRVFERVPDAAPATPRDNAAATGMQHRRKLFPPAS
jgi:hypothetical protein